MDMNPGMRDSWSRYRVSLFLLSILVLITYGRSAVTPSLLGDEWGTLYSYITPQGVSCPDWSAGRPLAFCYVLFAHGITGLNIYAFHALALLVSTISALLLLILLELLLPGWILFNSAVVALFLVYPADMARTWLAGSIVYYSGCYLAAACFLVGFWRRGHWWTWVIGMLLLFIALGTYEVAIGVTIFVSVAIGVGDRRQPWRHRVALIAPALVAVMFSLWRWYWQLRVGSAYGYSSEDVNFSPLSIGTRLLQGYRVNLLWGWTDSIADTLSAQGASGRTSEVISILIVVAVVLLLMFVASRLTTNSRLLDYISGVLDDDSHPVKALGMVAVVGLLIIGAGYFPGVFAYTPAMNYLDSRTHHLPSIGASILLCAVLWMLARLFVRDPSRQQLVALACLIPFLFIGVISQLAVQGQIEQAWTEQKVVWQSMLRLVPDIPEGTHVMLILPPKDANNRRVAPFVSGPWGMSSALKLLYGTDGISGHFVYGVPDESIEIDGDKLIVQGYYTAELPAKETLVFVQDAHSLQLARWDTSSPNGTARQVEAPHKTEIPSDSGGFRFLVQN